MSASPRLQVFVGRQYAGALSAERPDRYVFAYDPACPPPRFVSLTMPVRLESYVWHELHPVFQMSLPEGELLTRLRHRLAKTGAGTPLHLLAIVGAEMIGRVSLFPDGHAVVRGIDDGARYAPVVHRPRRAASCARRVGRHAQGHLRKQGKRG